MQRLRDERGAVAVMVALLMVPLIGFAAIAIDVAAMWSERQQLQNGADAGALADRPGLCPRHLREPRGNGADTRRRERPRRTDHRHRSRA